MCCLTIPPTGGGPQGRHPHALLPRGAQILDEIFLGLLTELVADGSPVWDDGELSKLCLSFGGHQMVRSGKAPVDQKAMAMYLASRPFLECHVRRRLKAIGNVTVLRGHDGGRVDVDGGSQSRHWGAGG
jgi:hypothetical protein